MSKNKTKIRTQQSLGGIQLQTSQTKRLPAKITKRNYRQNYFRKIKKTILCTERTETLKKRDRNTDT